ncbi:MAG: hypothetical protein DI528_13980 [Shinella sp.]|nr:MAG: hypothetical protein DI528_13980 [Shinella sp.]
MSIQEFIRSKFIVEAAAERMFRRVHFLFVANRGDLIGGLDEIQVTGIWPVSCLAGETRLIEIL